MSRTPVSLLLAAGLFAVGTASAQWTSVHRDATNNAVVPIPAVVTDVTAGPSLSSDSLGLTSAARPIIADGLVYTVYMNDAGTPFDASDDTIRLRAISLATLDLEWTSPDLDTGNAVSFGSAASPVFVDSGTSTTLYYGSGATVHAIDATDGSLVWATLLDDTSTTPSAAYELINASPVYGDGRVYVSTYYDSFSAPAELTQVVALDAVTGAIDWFRVTGGRGQAGPVFFSDSLPNPIVIANVPGGLVAYRADNGDLVWSHDGAVPGGSWSVTNEFWVEPIIADGSLFAATYNFGGTGANVVRVNPATGELIWKNDLSTTLTSDCPLLYAGSPARLYAVGGPFGDASLSTFDPASGTELTRTPLAIGVFRRYMAAVNDRVYLASSGVRVFDMSGATQSTYSTGSFSGAVTVNDDGILYLVSGGRLHRFDNTASVADWITLD